MINVQSEHAGVYYVEATLSNRQVLRSKPAYVIIKSDGINPLNAFLLAFSFYCPNRLRTSFYYTG
jgi:hypothetical protein